METNKNHPLKCIVYIIETLKGQNIFSSRWIKLNEDFSLGNVFLNELHTTIGNLEVGEGWKVYLLNKEEKLKYYTKPLMLDELG